MRLHIGRRRGADAGVVPGPLDREALPDRVRGGDPLAPAVARTRDAEQDGVDPVAVALGVGQALEDEQRRALAHDEPVGVRVERPRTGRRQRADLAELHERGDAHVAVDARR